MTYHPAPAPSITDETVARLFTQGLIAGIKDATGDLSRPVRLRQLCGDGLLQYSGDDATTPAYLAMGGHGCISVTANVVPALSTCLHRAWAAGDMAESTRLRDQLAPLHQALFSESNPIPGQGGAVPGGAMLRRPAPATDPRQRGHPGPAGPDAAGPARRRGGGRRPAPAEPGAVNAGRLPQPRPRAGGRSGCADGGDADRAGRAQGQFRADLPPGRPRPPSRWAACTCCPHRSARPGAGIPGSSRRAGP